MNRTRTLIAIMAAALSSMTYMAEGKDAGVPLFTYGIEWGYSSHIFSSYRHVYSTEEGYRAPAVSGGGWKYEGNGEILAHVGLNAGRHMNISAYTGYAGIGEGLRAVPVSLRFTCLFGHDPSAGRPFAFIEGGSGAIAGGMSSGVPIYSGKAGAGYRISLSDSVKLNFLLSFRLYYLHTTLYDGIEAIPSERIYRNDNYMASIGLGINLTF